MGTLFRQNDPKYTKTSFSWIKTPNNGYPFPPKWLLKMGTGLAASAAHPRRNQIWVPPPFQQDECFCSKLEIQVEYAKS